jgi:hypothetical protein
VALIILRVVAYTRAYFFALYLLVSFTLKMGAIRSSETSVLIRATRRHLPEDDNHQILYTLDRRLC